MFSNELNFGVSDRQQGASASREALANPLKWWAVKDSNLGPAD